MRFKKPDREFVSRLFGIVLLCVLLLVAGFVGWQVRELFASPAGEYVETEYGVFTSYANATTLYVTTIQELTSGGKVALYNVTLQSGSAFPSSPSDGELFYRTDQDLIYFYNSSSWLAVGFRDHGSLSGLSDDDHPIYLLASGTRTLTSDWAVGNHAITGVTWLNTTSMKFTDELWWDTENRTDVIAYPEQTASYIVFQDGSLTKKKNGTTGAVDWSSTDASAVINACIGNLTSGRTWKEEVILKGRFDITSPIYLSSYTKLTIEGQLRQKASLEAMIIILIDSQLVEINGGTLRGDKDLYTGHGILNRGYTTLENVVEYGDPLIIFNHVHIRDFSGNGVRDLGRKTRVVGGSVIRCNDSGYYVADTDHLFIGSLSKLNKNGFEVIGNFNLFFGCAADHNTEYGFLVHENNNIIVGGYAEWSGIDGIKFNWSNNNRVENVYIISNNRYGVYLEGSTRNIISGNRIFDTRTPYQQQYAIYEYHAVSDYNIFEFNRVDENLNTIYKVGANTKVKCNIGYVTENSGTAEASNDDWIAHGLAGTPTYVDLTVEETDANYCIQLKAKNSTHIQIYLYDLTAGALETVDKTINYYVEYVP